MAKALRNVEAEFIDGELAKLGPCGRVFKDNTHSLGRNPFGMMAPEDLDHGKVVEYWTAQFVP